MAIQLKKSKLALLIQHLKDQNSTEPEVLAELLEVSPEDTDTLAAYMRRARAESPVKTEEAVVYQLKDDHGLLQTLEVIRRKDNRIILARPNVTDFVEIMIRGHEVTVDLEKLRKLDPDLLQNGVKVSTLIAAAELAKG